MMGSVGSGATFVCERCRATVEDVSMRTTIALLSIAVITLTRLLPFVRWGEAPLGYDTGFYIQHAIRYLEGTLPDYGGPYFPVFWGLPLRLGIPPEIVVHASAFVAQLALAFACYLLGRTLIKGRGEIAGAVEAGGLAALVLFSLSVTQFLGYWWMFLRQEMATAFLLLALAAFLRRRVGWAILAGGFGAAVHPATFLPLGLTLFVVLVVSGIRVGASWWMARSWDPVGLADIRRVIAAGCGMLAVALLLNFPEFHGYGRILWESRGFVGSHIPAWRAEEFRGFFIDFRTAQLAAFTYIPFAIAGFVTTLRSAISRRDTAALFLLAFVVVTGLLSAHPNIIFNRRYILLFDLGLLALAVVPVIRFVRWLAETMEVRWSVVGVGVGLAASTLWFSWSSTPQIPPGELAEIQAIRTLAKDVPQARAMATSGVYTPWVYGYARLPTIAPGYLSENRWSFSEWRDFWTGHGGIARRHELFRRYPWPVYVVLGVHAPPVDLRTDSAFRQVSDHVWRYEPPPSTTVRLPS